MFLMCHISEVDDRGIRTVDTVDIIIIIYYVCIYVCREIYIFILDRLQSSPI